MSSLTVDEGEQAIHRWFEAAIHAVDPANAVAAALRCAGSTMFVDDEPVEIRGRLFVASIGKAAATMAVGARRVLGDRISSGVVITKDGHRGTAVLPEFELFEASHPIPDDRGKFATEQLLGRLSDLTASDVVLVLLSGGGSALLEAPIDGVSMDDISVTTDLLLRAGAPIHHLNAVRVPLSKVKGGGLRRAAPKSRFITLLLSDVLGNDTRVIASGPTVPTAFTAAGAFELLVHYGLLNSIPPSISNALKGVAPVPIATVNGDDIVVFVGDNSMAVEAFANSAREAGLIVRIALENAEGEARELAKAWVDEIVPSDPLVDLFVGGGEATVTVRSDGIGGRNTEFALAAALQLEQAGADDWVVASLATDGQDALTGVAGAIASIGTLRRARQAGIDPVQALERNDSLSVFQAAGGCVEPGPTGTNVNDIYVALRVSGAWSNQHN